ncbi:M23 family metallopeptidase [Paenibacillus mendelii]|uniref:Peptidoglycan DD-metalloendopeptidase family protein n=1 Tax=Paenibacillus mendelii TaxID=206163 RepID=A0ABV6J3K4_9BACL|nr:M23 family metallopeptidase [Paenibacillus mendelii]MCQ6561905.1 M23 family metallopeptidase [Paenibacillus mendelii]
MNDQNKPKLKEESPKTSMGGTAVKPSAWRKLLSKKWAAPAAFMAAAAIIVTLMWIYRGAEETPTTTGNDSLEVSQGTNEEAIETPIDDTLEVASSNETLQWPVVNRSELTVATPFYEASASNEERQAAMVQTGNTFTPHMGIDLTSSADKPFDVVAALSGRVIVVDKHPINGNVIEIKHADGIVTVYQSLSEVQVKVNEEVKQGSLIGKSGRSEIEKDYGNHLHFEVRQNGNSINPNTLLEQ